MLGETMVGWRVWDTLRAIDLLETRPEVDPKRVAMMGISGGGTVALYAAALDERVKAAVLSCSFCTFRDSIYSVAHCIDNYVPGILRDFEVADIAGLIAPRYLFAENGLDDDIFPVAGVRDGLRATVASSTAACRRSRRPRLLPGGHVFHGMEAFRHWAIGSEGTSSLDFSRPLLTDHRSLTTDNIRGTAPFMLYIGTDEGILPLVQRRAVADLPQPPGPGDRRHRLARRRRAGGAGRRRRGSGRA